MRILKHREVASFVIGCAIALSIFAVYYILQGGEHAAHASMLSKPADISKPYTAGRRVKLKRDISHNPKALLELTGRDVYELLDKPEMVRRDLPTVVWQYRSESCVLDLFYTASGENVLAEPVVHYEVRSRKIGEEGVKARHCVLGLLKPRGAFRVLNAQAFYKSAL